MATKANSKPRAKAAAKKSPAKTSAKKTAAKRAPARKTTARKTAMPAPIKTLIEDGLACPSCVSQDLRYLKKGQKEFLNCASCGAVYPIHHGAPHMIDNRALLRMDPELLGAWRVSQNNSLEEYKTDSAHSVSKAARDDVQQVIRYLEVYGMKVLDIGSGVYAPPEYLTEAGAANIIGLDPMIPESKPDLNLVGGIAEYTPFVDGSFDAVTIITSADHLIDIENGLRECARVLKPGGAIFVWIEYAADPKLLRQPTPFQRMPREKFAKSAGQTKDYEAWQTAEKELNTFMKKVDKNPKPFSRLMVDKYHLHHLGKDDWVQSLANSGLEIIADKPVTYPSGGQNNFLVIKKVADRVVAGPPELQTLNLIRAIPEAFEATAKTQAEATQVKLNELNAALESVRENIGNAGEAGVNPEIDSRFKNLADMIDALVARSVESNLVSSNEIKGLIGDLKGNLKAVPDRGVQAPAALNTALRAIELAIEENGREVVQKATAQDAALAEQIKTVDMVIAQLREDMSGLSGSLPQDRTDEITAKFDEISHSLHAAVTSNVSAAELEQGLGGLQSQMAGLADELKAAMAGNVSPEDLEALKQTISQGLQPLAGAKTVEDGFGAMGESVETGFSTLAQSLGALNERFDALQASALSPGDISRLKDFAQEGVRKADLDTLLDQAGKAATRDDLKSLLDRADKAPTRDDLKPLLDRADKGATRDDLKPLLDRADKAATKDDLKPILDRANKAATKDDLKALSEKGPTKDDLKPLTEFTRDAAKRSDIETVAHDVKSARELADRRARRLEDNLKTTRESLDALVSERSDALGKDISATQAAFARHVTELKGQIEAAESALKSAQTSAETGLSSKIDQHLEASITASKASLETAENALGRLIGELPAQINRMVDERLSRAEADLAQRLEEAVTNRVEPKVDSVRVTMLDQGTYFESLIGGATEAANTANAGIARIEATLAYKSPARRFFEGVFNVIAWPFVMLFKLVWLILWPFRKIARAGLKLWSIFFGKTHARLRMRVLRALFRPAPRRKNLGKRIMMITISQIEIDPRINKAARTLAQAGYEVDIMCQQPNIVDEDITFEDVYPGVRWVRVKWKPDYIRFWNWYQDIYAHALEELHYDYIHVNDLTAAAVGWMGARAKGVPLIYDAHEMWSENVFFDGEKYVEMPLKDRLFGRWYEGFILKYTDSFFSVSNSINLEYERRYGKKPLLLANFPDVTNMDIDTTDYPSVREMANIPEDKFVTIYIGGLGPARNIETIVEAHAHLDDDFVFVIRGPEAEKWGEPHLEQARDLGIEHRIKVLPGVGRDEVIAGMKGANAGVVMLKNLCKNFYWYYPNKFFEYQLGGLPVLVSNFPDVTEHVEREQSGMTFDPSDPVDAARAIREMAADRQAAYEMGQRGRASILSTYNWEEAMKLMIGEYDRLEAESQK
ncbi:glycosyltransferase [Hyphobacterium sp.]|uniref:glycosyltransferase n=1 Tax=Hyphobacterium sp. TaxID=2004662 RepID=UPI003BA9FABE